MSVMTIIISITRAEPEQIVVQNMKQQPNLKSCVFHIYNKIEGKCHQFEGRGMQYAQRGKKLLKNFSTYSLVDYLAADRQQTGLEEHFFNAHFKSIEI